VRDVDEGTLFYSRTGKSLRIFPFGDYLFFHRYCISEFEIRKLHEKDKVFVNKKYPVTHSLRWTVPNIASIFLFEHDVPESLIKLTKLPVKDFWGGEIHTISLIDLDKKIAYTSDNTKHYVKVDEFSIRNKLADKVDPAIRTNAIIHTIINLSRGLKLG
jgi:hypothetical protein